MNGRDSAVPMNFHHIKSALNRVNCRAFGPPMTKTEIGKEAILTLSGGPICDTLHRSLRSTTPLGGCDAWTYPGKDSATCRRHLPSLRRWLTDKSSVTVS